MKTYLEKYYWLFFLLVTVFLLYPTFSGGYVFLLDWQIKPFMSFSDIDFWSDTFYQMVSKLLAVFLSFAVFQRVILLATVFLLGITGFHLAKKTGNIYARYFSGLFLIFNPFIYGRVLEQTGIALGCAVFYWFLVYLMDYLDDRNKKNLITASILAGVVSGIFFHSVFFLYFSSVILLVSYLIRKNEPVFVMKTFLAVFAVVFILNLNWLLGMAVKKYDGRIKNMANFSQNDLETFRTREIGDMSIYSTVLSLQGYWGERQNRFVSIQENPVWMPAWLAILCLSLFGLIKTWKTDKWAKPVFILGLLAYILAVGVSSGLTKPVSLFLYDHFPFYIGLRESQKWSGVLVFVFAYFGARGVASFLELKYLEKKPFKHIYWAPLAAVLPVFFSFSMIGGIHEHLKPKQFPAEWYEAKEYLSDSQGKVLFFPWHSYMKFSFAGKNISNPAKSFFGNNVIQARNTEFGSVYTTEFLSDETLLIKKYAEGTTDYSGFAEDMKKSNIHAIILSKTEDWHDYLWLDGQGLEKPIDNEKLIIYEAGE